jgi:hypothetical protein
VSETVTHLTRVAPALWIVCSKIEVAHPTPDRYVVSPASHRMEHASLDNGFPPHLAIYMHALLLMYTSCLACVFPLLGSVDLGVSYLVF